MPENHHGSFKEPGAEEPGAEEPGAEEPGAEEPAGIDPGDVLAWGTPRLRDLPWRRTRDPWAILVSEVMLQQTQVVRVEQRWHAFLDRYPDPAACASAALGEVLRDWQGLGYPRRARNLHATAQLVVRDHDGALPDGLEALLALPGIGPYTARAVLAFAFERDVAVVDTNIARILARTAGERLSPTRAQTTADAMVPSEHGWIWNQVLMDLGATVCRPVPKCQECPVADRCSWASSGRPDPDPAIGSAGVSQPQARFEGSRRQARGRVLHALGAGPAREDAWEPGVIESLVVDGLVVRIGRGKIALPG